MKKIHILKSRWEPDDIAYMRRQGVQVKEGTTAISSARIEDDDVYYDVKNRFERKYNGFLEFLYYEYTREEILSAPYCLLVRTLHFAGYPRPLNSYMSKTFDMSNACPSCHMGRNQKGPFRIAKVAKPGFWQFYAWEPSVFFVSDKIYESVFANYGIERIPVKRTSGEIVEGFSQLVFPVSSEPLDLYAYEYEICPNCGKKRFLPGEFVNHPYFPLHNTPLRGGYAVKEVFGQGWIVSQPILLSAELIAMLIELKEIDCNLLIPCTSNIEQYWGPKSDYSVNHPK